MGEPPAAPLLDISKLHVRYGNLRALNNVSLRVYRGEIVAVIGANGAGKVDVAQRHLAHRSGIPPLSLGFFAFDTDRRNAYLAMAVAFLFLILADNIMRSRVGRSLRAISDNEAVAASLGVNVKRYKLFIFALSAALTGLGGTLYAGYLSYILPDAFRIILSIQFLLMAIVGGFRSVWGAPIGAALIVLLEQGLESASGHTSTAVQVIVKSVAYGAILVTFVIFLPDGLTGLLARARHSLPAWLGAHRN